MTPDYMDEIWNATTLAPSLSFSSGSTSTVTQPQKPFSMDALLAAIQKIPPCPIATWMRSQGCDPDNGAVLFVPLGHELDTDLVPRYVRVSKHISAPLLTYDITLRLGQQFCHIRAKGIP